jgi:ABC-type glutathione transport system ATPase component
VPGERRRRLYSIPGQVPDLAALPAGCAFADRCQRASALPPELPPLWEQRGRPPAFTPYPRGRLHEHESHEYVIEVDGLKKHFPLREGLFGQQTGQLRAVDGVSFRIRRDHFRPGGRIRQRENHRGPHAAGAVREERR